MYMTVFAGVLIGSFIIAFLARSISTGRPGGLGQPKPNPIGFILPAIAFSVFAGLRNNLGDTELYALEYELMETEGVSEVPLQFKGGSLYPYIITTFHLQGRQFSDVVLVTSFLAIVPVIYILYKYCISYELGVALFVLTGYYTFAMNGIRQYCAAGVLILGTKYLLSDKKLDFIKYIPFVIVAWLFHTSAILMLLVYFIVRRKAWTPFTMVLLVGTVFATMIFDAILPAFLGVLEDTAYGNYAQNGWFTAGEEGGSDIIRVIVLAVPLVMAYMTREKLRFIHGPKWDILVNLSILNIAFYILSLYNWIFARLAIYTSIYVIIMTTYVIKEAFEENGSLIYGASLGLYSIYFNFISYSVTGYRSDFY